MQQEQYRFDFEVYESIAQLTKEDAWLLNEAKKLTAQAYAPYSHFRVGAVARLVSGELVNGTNQENASFPVGICAERVLLSAASSLFPGQPVESIAISYHHDHGESNRPISPCGICRQTLLEYEQRMNHPIRLILGGEEGKVYIIPKASLLLPLSFSVENMK